MVGSDFHNTNTEFPNLGHKIAFDELYKLKKLYLSNNSECDKNYVPIRLVTIIEHFFRTLLKQRLINEPKFKPKITVKYQLLLNSLNTAIQKYVDDDTVHENSLKEAIDRHANKNTRHSTDDKIEFENAWVLDCLIEDVCGHYWWHGIREDIQASSFSFQNVHYIKEHFKTVFDVVNEGKYDKFFNVRHKITHTLNAENISVSDCFKIVEKLMLTVLEQENGRHWVDFYLGAMAQDYGKKADAIDFFCQSAKEGNEWASCHLGWLLQDGDTKEAKQYLKSATNLAHKRVLNTRLLRHRMNAKINIELENYGKITCFAMIVYEVMDDSDAANECLENAIETASSFNGLYKHLVLMLIRLGRNGQAILCCEAGIASTHDYILKAQLHYWYARALINTDSMAEAQDHLYKALSIYPDYEPAFDLLNWMLGTLKSTNT